MRFLTKRLAAASAMLSLVVSNILPAYAAGIVNIKPNGSGGFTITPPGAGSALPSMGQNLSSFQSTVEATLMPTVQSVAQMITAVCTVVCFVAFLISVTKLATSAGNPVARQRALHGILFSGIALALFGGAWTVVSIFWNFLA